MVRKMSHKVTSEIVWSARPRGLNWSSFSESRVFFSHFLLIRLKIPLYVLFSRRFIFFFLVPRDSPCFLYSSFCSLFFPRQNSRCIKLFECCIKYAEVIKPAPFVSLFFCVRSTKRTDKPLIWQKVQKLTTFQKTHRLQGLPSKIFILLFLLRFTRSKLCHHFFSF